MATLKLEIVTPEGVTYSEDVEMVTLPGVEDRDAADGPRSDKFRPPLRQRCLAAGGEDSPGSAHGDGPFDRRLSAGHAFDRQAHRLTVVLPEAQSERCRYVVDVDERDAGFPVRSTPHMDEHEPRWSTSS